MDNWLDKAMRKMYIQWNNYMYQHDIVTKRTFSSLI